MTSPTDGLIDTMFTHTEGNPFFVAEVIRLLSDEGTLTNEGSGVSQPRIPEGVREVIGQRLNKLSVECNQTLTIASVIGREFDFKTLHSLSSYDDEDRLLEVLDEALEAGIINGLPRGLERYQFSHALVQETLVDELSARRRVRLHARIGEALEELYGSEVEAHAAELVHHFAQAEAVVGAEKLVHYSLLAGERALASYAYEDALIHFERGLVARGMNLSGTKTASNEQAAALLFGLARAQSTTVEAHQLGEAFATLSRAFDYHSQSGNVALAVAAAEFPIANPAYPIPGAAHLMARALTLVPTDSHGAGRLLSRYGAILGVAEGDYEGAQQALWRAISIAEREGDVPLEVRTLTYAANVSGQNLQWQESLEYGLRAIELSTGDENAVYDSNPRYWTALSLLVLGDLDGARPHALVLRERGSQRVAASNSYMPIVYLSYLEGDWQAGREYSDLGLEVSPLNLLLLSLRVLLEHETGESAQGEIYLERLLEEMGRAGPGRKLASAWGSMAITSVARITGFLDRLEIAEAAAEAVLSEQSVQPRNVLIAKTELALEAVLKGDQAAAEELYAYFLGHRGTMSVSSSVDRLLGLLSQTMGDLDQASVHFEDALDFSRKAGFRPELAWTCCDYADLLLQRNGSGDHVKARLLLEESSMLGNQLGMRPLVERVTAAQARVQPQPSSSSVYPDGLTQREVEVLRLMSEGKSNKEIATDLLLSIRTVERHVSNIYVKLGARSRADAIAYALRCSLSGHT